MLKKRFGKRRNRQFQPFKAQKFQRLHVTVAVSCSAFIPQNPKRLQTFLYPLLRKPKKFYTVAVMASSSSLFRTGISSMWRFSATHQISAASECRQTMYNGKRLRHFSKPYFFPTNVSALSKLRFISTNVKTSTLKKPIQKESVVEFIDLFEDLVESRNQTIQEAQKNQTYKPYSKEWKKWAESFYVLKGESTTASLISLCALPDFLRNIYNVSSHESYRRDFVLYKNIPLPDVSMDYRYNFQQEGDYRHIISPTVKLSSDGLLPEGYQSVLSQPEGYHIVLDSPSLRIISHVTREELFRCWKLDFHEQETQINMLCRRNGLKRMEALMSRSGK